MLLHVLLLLIFQSPCGFVNGREYFSSKPIVYDFHNFTLKLAWSNGMTVKADLVQAEADCIFHGSFQEDHASSVLVTGCDGLDIQYHSQVVGDYILVGIDGEVVQYGHAKNNNQRNRISELSEPEEDYVENLDFYSEYVLPEARKVPSVMKLNVNLYLNYQWINLHGGRAKSKAKEVFSHVQQLFSHNLLETKIIISHNNIYKSAERLETTEEDLEKLENHLVGPWTIGGSNVAHVFLTHTKRVFTSSISVQDSICDADVRKPRSITRWDRSTSRTAVAVAHALAHNLGVRHDFDLGSGLLDSCKEEGWSEDMIKNYAGSGVAWSSCSQREFAKYYSRVVSRNGMFCL